MGAGGVSGPSREPICRDAADQKQENRRDATETDGQRQMRAESAEETANTGASLLPVYVYVAP